MIKLNGFMKNLNFGQSNSPRMKFWLRGVKFSNRVKPDSETGCLPAGFPGTVMPEVHDK
jgi:hypothetical protein